MSKRRSRLEIFLRILSAVRDGVCKPTRIMYAVALSWNPLKLILSSMVEQNLLRVREGRSRRTYEITEKGLNALRYFEDAKGLLEI